MQGFEDALSSLLKDVKSIENEHFRMEEKFNRFVKIITMKNKASLKHIYEQCITQTNNLLFYLTQYTKWFLSLPKILLDFVLYSFSLIIFYKRMWMVVSQTVKNVNYSTVFQCYILFSVCVTLPFKIIYNKLWEKRSAALFTKLLGDGKPPRKTKKGCRAKLNHTEKKPFCTYQRLYLCRWFRFAQLAKGKKFRP